MWRKLGVILRKDDIVSDFLEKKSSQRWVIYHTPTALVLSNII
jgi:hypothetical protein